MLEYMPGPHKVFCEIFAQKLHKVGSIKVWICIFPVFVAVQFNRPSLTNAPGFACSPPHLLLQQDFVQKCNLVTKTKKIAEAEMLSAAYTHCVDAFHRFRQFHLGVATKYVLDPSMH